MNPLPYFYGSQIHQKRQENMNKIILIVATAAHTSQNLPIFCPTLSWYGCVINFTSLLYVMLSISVHCTAKNNTRTYSHVELKYIYLNICICDACGIDWALRSFWPLVEQKNAVTLSNWYPAQFEFFAVTYYSYNITIVRAQQFHSNLIAMNSIIVGPVVLV